MCEVMTWLVDSRDPTRFPYDAVLYEYQKVGKQFVSLELLGVLGQVRAGLPPPGSSPDLRRLRSFLDVALDKADDRYDYRTYIAVDLLPIRCDPAVQAAAALRDRDRVVARLIADMLRFELAAADRRTDLLPQMRPDEQLASKRFRLAVRAARAALQRLRLADEITLDGPVAAARLVWAAVDADLSVDERLDLRLSMMPVYLVHDEYMFIRVLQAFEVTFALLAVDLSAAVTALGGGHAEAAAQRLDAATTVLGETAPLFSLMATMQVLSFHAFRQHTEGASAIQSRPYKMVEALCRRPDPDRLHSAAYRCVPEVRDLVLAGQPNLSQTYGAVGDALSAAERVRLDQAMSGFAAALLRWRQTHYRLAVRMLGDRRGTGATDGTAYLRSTRAIAVFHEQPTAGRPNGGTTRRHRAAHHASAGCLISEGR